MAMTPNIVVRNHEYDEPTSFFTYVFRGHITNTREEVLLRVRRGLCVTIDNKRMFGQPLLHRLVYVHLGDNEEGLYERALSVGMRQNADGSLTDHYHVTWHFLGNVDGGHVGNIEDFMADDDDADYYDNYPSDWSPNH